METNKQKNSQNVSFLVTKGKLNTINNNKNCFCVNDLECLTLKKLNYVNVNKAIFIQDLTPFQSLDIMSKRFTTDKLKVLNQKDFSMVYEFSIVLNPSDVTIYMKDSNGLIPEGCKQKKKSQKLLREIKKLKMGQAIIYDRLMNNQNYVNEKKWHHNLAGKFLKMIISIIIIVSHAKKFISLLVILIKYLMEL